MSLESILERILSDANSQREQIVKEAKSQADKIILEAKAQSEELYQQGMDKEKFFYENKKQKLVVNARLESRKNLLKAKQEIIDEVFEKLKSTLKHDHFKKQQVCLDKTKETAEDIDFYLSKLRQDYETEIAQMLF